MDKITIENLLPELLKTSIVTVTFIKKDSTERVMKCTLKPDLLPLQVVNEDKPAKKKSETSIAVYDLEINAWRSIIYNSVISIRVPSKEYNPNDADEMYNAGKFDRIINFQLNE